MRTRGPLSLFCLRDKWSEIRTMGHRGDTGDGSMCNTRVELMFIEDPRDPGVEVLIMEADAALMDKLRGKNGRMRGGVVKWL